MVFARTKKIFLLFLVLFLIILFLFLTANKTENNGKKHLFNDLFPPQRESVVINGVRISVDIADTPEKRTKGLSGRSFLAENEGVFFIFDAPYQYSFWMKDMNFPIDIIWIDENFIIADITTHVLPESFPNTFQPRFPVRYVLETVAGWADKYGVEVGDTVLLNK